MENDKSANSGRWEHFAHDADMGVRGIGAGLNEAFAQAALALTAVITDVRGVDARTPVRFCADAPDPELLLVDFLNRLIYEMATRAMLFSRYEVSIEGSHLSATAWGEHLDMERHRPTVEVKGATYTELSVRREGEAWIAQCVVDV